ncbi:MAG: hypothetical protein ACLSB9_24115 [Hydrogeniiclostridium mannosilyticum]
MGRRNKAYHKDLHQQAYERLTSMQAFGESRKEAKANGTDKDKIFSFSTYQSYWKHTKYFIKYIKEHHPECTTLKSARKYVNEWLQDGVDRGLSAWTIGVQRSAMGKLYGISPDDEDFFKAPKKERENIKRSRGDRVRDKHFSKTNNDGLIKFVRGLGCVGRNWRSCGGRIWSPENRSRLSYPSWRAGLQRNRRRPTPSGWKCSRTPFYSRRVTLPMSATERAAESV